MLELTIKGEPKELVEFFGTLEEEKSTLLIKEIAPLVAKRISISEIVRTESHYRDCTVAELADALISHLKHNQKNESPLT